MKAVLNLQTENMSKNIKWEYDILYENFFEYSHSFNENIRAFKQMVSIKCQEGWIPQGSFSIVENKGSKYMCQTMISPIVDYDEESKMRLTNNA